MRAARALDMMLLLQRRGKMTAGELAAHLEVTERTVLRDVVVLSEAGVPVYATRGSGGGIELIDGFQTNLTGLTTDEASAFFLAGQPEVAHRMGLAAVARSVREKLLAALTTEQVQQAEGLANWFVHDPDPWEGTRIPHGELRRIAGAIHRRRRIELTIGSEPTMVVGPLGLVNKAGSWFVVHVGAGIPEILCIDDLRGTRITRHGFEPPADFELSAFWAGHVRDRTSG